jgi:hypothetical protein
MKVLSHRGHWTTPGEKNHEVAFRRSFALGFGTETDLRDCAGEIVIAHDMPRGGEMTLSAFLALVPDPELTLALNIKADGLCRGVKEAMASAGHRSWFVFDMSVPDLLLYRRERVPYFTRLSEYEMEPAALAEAAGVWVDGFHGRWWTSDKIKRLLDSGKRVCMVSPELHGREPADEWAALKPLAGYEGLMICTDLPERAQAYFGDKQ